MLLGIDVGGTFTDAVLIKDQKILHSVKNQTTHDDISKGLLLSLEKILEKVKNTGEIKRVAISTTVITNAAVTGKLDNAAIAVMPGPGYNCENAFPVKPEIFSGYTDHRGEQFLPSSFSNAHLEKLKKNDAIAVSAKFSVRDASGELALIKALKDIGAENIVSGHEMSGQLGFIRRTNSAYYTAATKRLFGNFIELIKKSLEKNNVKAPLYILKADGGTMPEKWAKKHTVEAFFTGPAASVMGVKALVNPDKRAISIDIGGTTTDIAFWENSLPLYAKRGAKINGYPTSVRALQLHSLAIGGDSTVKRDGDVLKVGPERFGPAMALGGNHPTLTDAFLLLGLDKFGDIKKAQDAMELLKKDGETALDIAQKVVDSAIGEIINTIDEMIKEHSLQPVYKVEDVVNDKPFMPEILLGVGGAAKAILPVLAKKMQLDFYVPENAVVANAVGAALARPTIMADIHADTALGECVLPQNSAKDKISKTFSRIDAEAILTSYLKNKAKELDMEFYGAETVWYEEFPVIKDSWRSGNRINLSMQLKPGVLYSVKGDDT